jgi:hypothetical protein
LAWLDSVAVLGDRGHHRQNGNRVQAGGVLDAVGHARGEAVAVGVGHRQSVGEERQVELAALEDPGDVLVQLGRQELGPRLGVAPHRVAVSDRTGDQKRGQVHLAAAGRSVHSVRL